MILLLAVMLVSRAWVAKIWCPCTTRASSYGAQRLERHTREKLGRETNWTRELGLEREGAVLSELECGEFNWLVAGSKGKEQGGREGRKAGFGGAGFGYIPSAWLVLVCTAAGIFSSSTS